jgi:hypothetical protein
MPRTVTLDQIDFSAEALGAIRERDGWLVTRPTLDGRRFAVLKAEGPGRRLISDFATEAEARRYMARLAAGGGAKAPAMPPLRPAPAAPVTPVACCCSCGRADPGCICEF